MNLSNLTRPQKKQGKRVGRGESSGLRKTSGKGHKGQRSRSGGKVGRGFEGGQMPLQRRLPKKGFNNPSKIRYNVINVKDLARLEPGSVVTTEVLREKGLVKRQGPVKLLSVGDAPDAYTIRVERVSAAAKQKIEAAGGTVEAL
jgi:large subunit ribosomal protein L15